MNDWVNIYSSDQEYHIQIARNILSDNGIDSFVMNKRDSNYLFGDVELMVRRKDTVKAKYILKSIEIE
jgi:hypothetical protein